MSGRSALQTMRTPSRAMRERSAASVGRLHHHHVAAVAAAPIEPATRGRAGRRRRHHLQERVADRQQRVLQAEDGDAGIAEPHLEVQDGAEVGDHRLEVPRDERHLSQSHAAPLAESVASHDRPEASRVPRRGAMPPAMSTGNGGPNLIDIFKQLVADELRRRPEPSAGQFKDPMGEPFPGAVEALARVCAGIARDSQGTFPSVPPGVGAAQLAAIIVGKLAGPSDVRMIHVPQVTAILGSGIENRHQPIPPPGEFRPLVVLAIGLCPETTFHSAVSATGDKVAAMYVRAIETAPAAPLSMTVGEAVAAKTPLKVRQKKAPVRKKGGPRRRTTGKPKPKPKSKPTPRSKAKLARATARKAPPRAKKRRRQTPKKPPARQGTPHTAALTVTAAAPS